MDGASEAHRPLSAEPVTTRNLSESSAAVKCLVVIVYIDSYWEGLHAATLDEERVNPRHVRKDFQCDRLVRRFSIRRPEKADL